jgi:5-methylcytosine-specific restriction enzyme A
VIKIRGTVCQVCGFDFDKVYGRDYADSYIEVHHIRPLSEHEGEVDPATDLVSPLVPPLRELPQDGA